MVSIPIILEIVFVALLWCLIQQAEQEFDRQQISKRLIMEVQAVESAAAKVFSMAMMSSKGQDEGALAAIGEVRNTFIRAQNQIPFYKAARPDLRDYLDDANATYMKALALADKAESIINNPAILPRKRPKYLRNDFFEVLRELRPQITRLLEHEKKIQASAPESLQARQTTISILLGAGVAGSMAISAFLAVYFGRDFANRLRRISNNAKLMVLNLPMPAPLPGTDEIAQLDMTLHEASEKLNELRSKEVALIENAVDIVCELDEQGKFVLVSSASIKIWWLNPDEIIGRTVYEIVEPRDHAILTSTLRDAHDGKEHSFETNIVRKDGAIINTIWTVRWSEERKIFHATAHDNTKRAEMDELKRQFVAMVSHDLRTPLTSVSASLFMLSEGVRGPLSPEFSTTIGDCTTKLDDVVKLVEAVIEFEKLESGKLIMDLGCASVVDVLTMVTESLDKQIQTSGITVSPANRDASIYVDQRRLEHALTQLMSILLANSGAGDRIDVKVEQSDELVEIQFCAAAKAISSIALSNMETRSAFQETADIPVALLSGIIKAQKGELKVVPEQSLVAVSLPAFKQTESAITSKETEREV